MCWPKVLHLFRFAKQLRRKVTWIGYPNTTGLTRCDYRFTDVHVDPLDTKQRFTEKLIRLPESFLCYTPSTEVGEPAECTPALKNGLVTFGSFNNLAKMTTEVFSTYADVLKGVPGSVGRSLP